MSKAYQKNGLPDIWLCEDLGNKLIYISQNKTLYLGTPQNKRNRCAIIDLLEPEQARELKITCKKIDEYYEKTWGIWIKEHKVNYI